MVALTLAAIVFFGHSDLFDNFGPKVSRQTLDFIENTSKVPVNYLVAIANKGGFLSFGLMVLGVVTCLLPDNIGDKSHIQADLLKRIGLIRLFLNGCAALLVVSVLEIGALYNMGASLISDPDMSANISKLAVNLGVLFGALFSLALVCFFAPTVWVLGDQIEMLGLRRTEGEESPLDDISPMKQLKISDVVAIISPLIAGGPITALLSMFAQHGS